jgi:protein-disulfide isomerase/uncharacterized membrane protein YphA (DoxX/SURF4 family)
VNWTVARAWVGTICRLVLGAVFLWAGAAKLDDPAAFVRVVRAYDATPEWLSKGIGYGLPVLEICLAALLIAGVVTRIAAAVAGSLLVIFLIGIIEAAARGIKLQCGCFGGGGATDRSTTYLLDSARDIGLIVLAVYLIVWPLTKLSTDQFLVRNDHIKPLSAKQARVEQNVRKYNAVLDARRRRARGRTRVLGGVSASLVLLICAIGIGVQSNRAKVSVDTATATNATARNGVVIGRKSPVTIDVFEDFQCPYCQQFQESAGADLNKYGNGNTAQVRYHMVAFLDSSSDGNKYSTRAANAALCASDVSPATFLKYHDYLYGKGADGKLIQPAEGSSGRTDNDLDDYAKAIGIDSDALTTFQSCVQTKAHVGLVNATTEDWSKRGYNSTPMVLVNGKALKEMTKAALDSAVDAAVAAAIATQAK